MPKLLFIQTAFVGDLLLSIPTLKHLRKIHGDSQITLLCRKGLGSFMLESGIVDEVVEADKASGDSWSAVVEQLQAVNWKAVYCPHQSTRSLLLVRSLESQEKIGYRSLLGKIVFTRSVERPMQLPEALRQLVLVSSDEVRAGIAKFENVEAVNFNLAANIRKSSEFKASTYSTALQSVPDWASMHVTKLLSLKSDWQNKKVSAFDSKVQALLARAGSKQIVVLAPGSLWNTKRWIEDGFAEMARKYVREGKIVFLVGSPDEKEICEKVRITAVASLRTDSGVQAPAESVINVAGDLTLWQSAELMSAAKLVLSNDSGAMHIAACASTPTVSVFGPTVLSQGYRPWQTHARVLSVDLSCRPCGKHGSQKCPIGTHECMKSVSADEVARAASELI